jgi:hypothetical protein
VKAGNQGDPMGANHRIVPAIKQALSMLRQAREALFFAQCPAAVANVRQAIKSTEGALRTAKAFDTEAVASKPLCTEDSSRPRFLGPK